MKPGNLRAIAVSFLIFLCPATILSQSTNYTITGTVVDALTDKAVDFSTVALLDHQGAPVSAAAADGSGKFSVSVRDTGNYVLSVSYVGYLTFTREMFIDGSNKNIDAGKLLLEPGLEVEKITVTVQQPLVVADVDKLTYSVEADPEAQTSTLAEIIRKVPQLSIDAEDNVKLNGQGDYKVLVNGKSSSMMANNFKEVIQSMPANSVKSIEVITNPSTKYEAEGIGGIINIITAKKYINGYNGSIGGGVSSYNSYNGNANLTTQFGKINIGARYFFNRNGSPNNRSFSERTNKNNNEYYYNKTVSKGKSHGFSNSLSLEASYEIDTFNLISVSGWGWWNNSKSRSVSNSDVWARDSSLTQSFRNTNNGKSTSGSVSGSIDWQRTFMKPDRTLTVSYKLDNNPRKSDYDYIIDETYNYQAEIRRSSNDAGGSEHTAQVDYYDPLNEKHNIEAGVKYIFRLNTSDTYNYIDDMDHWIPDPSRWDNILDYRQNIYGIYGGYLFKLKKLSFKVGGRIEGTADNVKTNEEAEVIKFSNNQFNVVPYVNISYMIKQGQSVRFSYTQRLRRPGIWHLNPYRNDSDPMNIRYGNPDLKAVVSHSFNVNYNMFKTDWSFFLGANINFANNSITDITTVDQDGVSESTYKNIGKDQRYGLNGSFSYRVGMIFNVNLSGNANYSVIEAPQQNLKNEGFNFGGNLGASVTLWKEARFTANAGVFSSSVSLQGRGSTFYYTSMSISQRLLKKKMDLSLNISEPFKKNRTWSYTSEDQNFSSYSEGKYYARRFSFRISYRFGKMDVNVRKSRRSISNDDSMGGGGDGGGGQ